MRLNKFIANNSRISRREADELIKSGLVNVNGQEAIIGQKVNPDDVVLVNNQPFKNSSKTIVIFNKPAGYVCSRSGQSAPTIYELLPSKYQFLKSVGRLDKNSTGLILLTNDGDFAHRMTHPSFGKKKTYEVELDQPLSAAHQIKIKDGVELEDGISKLLLESVKDNRLKLSMREGRNRQIRRTFAALGYEVTKLHRIVFGEYELDGLRSGKFLEVNHE